MRWTLEVLLMAPPIISAFDAFWRLFIFDVGTSVHRLDLNTGVDTVLNVPNALAINALHYANGHLWIAQRTAATSEILVADAVSWQLDDSVKFNLTQVASSLAEDHGFLAVGLGGDGVTIYDLSGHLQELTVPWWRLL